MIEYDELYNEVQKRLSEKNFLGKKSNFPDSKAF